MMRIGIPLHTSHLRCYPVRRFSSSIIRRSAETPDFSRIIEDLLSRPGNIIDDPVNPENSELLKQLLSESLPSVCQAPPYGFNTRGLGNWYTSDHGIGNIDVGNNRLYLPQGHHLVYFPTRVHQSQLLEDGTDVLHFPGPPFVRRLWAGGSLTFNTDLDSLFHSPMKRKSLKTKSGHNIWSSCLEKIKNVRVKGPPQEEKIIVDIERKYLPADLNKSLINPDKSFQDSGSLEVFYKNGFFQNASIYEKRTLVFMRNDGQTDRGGKQAKFDRLVKSAITPEFTMSFVPTPSLLFRFSALTYNAHLIHLSPQHASEVEGLRNTIVHGPLTVVLMMSLLRGQLEDGEMITSFDYQNLAPLYVNEEMHICGKRNVDGTFRVWINDSRGSLAVKGTASIGNVQLDDSFSIAPSTVALPSDKNESETPMLKPEASDSVKSDVLSVRRYTSKTAPRALASMIHSKHKSLDSSKISEDLSSHASPPPRTIGPDGSRPIEPTPSKGYLEAKNTLQGTEIEGSTPEKAIPTMHGNSPDSSQPKNATPKSEPRKASHSTTSTPLEDPTPSQGPTKATFGIRKHYTVGSPRSLEGGEFVVHKYVSSPDQPAPEIEEAIQKFIKLKEARSIDELRKQFERLKTHPRRSRSQQRRKLPTRKWFPPGRSKSLQRRKLATRKYFVAGSIRKYFGDGSSSEIDQAIEKSIKIKEARSKNEAEKRSLRLRMHPTLTRLGTLKLRRMIQFSQSLPSDENPLKFQAIEKRIQRQLMQRKKLRENARMLRIKSTIRNRGHRDVKVVKIRRKFRSLIRRELKEVKSGSGFLYLFKNRPTAGRFSLWNDKERRRKMSDVEREREKWEDLRLVGELKGLVGGSELFGEEKEKGKGD